MKGKTKKKQIILLTKLSASMFLVQDFGESKSWFPFSNLQRLSFSTESIYASVYKLYLLGLGFVILFYFFLVCVWHFSNHCFSNKDNYFLNNLSLPFPVFVHSDSVLDPSALFLSYFQSVLVLI